MSDRLRLLSDYLRFTSNYSPTHLQLLSNCPLIPEIGEQLENDWRTIGERLEALRITIGHEIVAEYFGTFAENAYLCTQNVSRERPTYHLKQDNGRSEQYPTGVE